MERNSIFYLEDFYVFISEWFESWTIRGRDSIRILLMSDTSQMENFSADIKWSSSNSRVEYWYLLFELWVWTTCIILYFIKSPGLDRRDRGDCIVWWNTLGIITVKVLTSGCILNSVFSFRMHAMMIRSRTETETKIAKKIAINFYKTRIASSSI